MTEPTCEICGAGGKLTRRMCARDYRWWLDHTPPDQRPVAPRFARTFWDSVSKDGSVPAHNPGLGPCWTWSGPADRKGYGRWSKVLAHRHSWTLANGPIDGDLWVLHHCDNPPCVNPAHLYLGTVVENVRDMLERGRNYIPPLAPECAAGHEMAGSNVRVRRDGSRTCWACDNARSADWQRERRRSQGAVSNRVGAGEAARICELRRSGLSQRKIAAEVGRTLDTVQRALRNEGLRGVA